MLLYPTLRHNPQLIPGSQEMQGRDKGRQKETLGECRKGRTFLGNWPDLSKCQPHERRGRREVWENVLDWRRHRNRKTKYNMNLGCYVRKDWA